MQAGLHPLSRGLNLSKLHACARGHATRRAQSPHLTAEHAGGLGCLHPSDRRTTYGRLHLLPPHTMVTGSATPGPPPPPAGPPTQKVSDVISSFRPARVSLSSIFCSLKVQCPDRRAALQVRRFRHLHHLSRLRRHRRARNSRSRRRHAPDLQLQRGKACQRAQVAEVWSAPGALLTPCAEHHLRQHKGR